MIDKLKTYGGQAVRFGVRWNIIKLTFALGAISGMLFMAILMAGGQATLALIEAMR